MGLKKFGGDSSGGGKVLGGETSGGRSLFGGDFGGRSINEAGNRANGVVVSKDQFLKDVKSRDQSKTEIESIKIYGKNRAVVTCVVTLKIDGQTTGFHNVRLFIREGSDWKLLGWANEKLTD